MNGTDKAAPRTSLSQDLLTACEEMVRYAIGIGRPIPAQVLAAVDGARERAPGRPVAVAGLTRAYDELAELVAPATPRTIHFLQQQKQGRRFMPTFGTVRVVRNLVAAATISLVLFVVIAASPAVQAGSSDIFAGSGWDLLVNEMFLLSAAGMGAAFAALFRANQFIANGSFDPYLESTYWARFLLGLIAGLVLSQLVSLGEGQGQVLTKPLLALLGGFSAGVLHTVLRRLVETVESLVKGSSQDLVEAQASAAKANAAEQLVRSRLRTATAISQARERLAGGAGSAEVQAQLDDILASLLPGDIVLPDAEAPAIPAQAGGAPAS